MNPVKKHMHDAGRDGAVHKDRKKDSKAGKTKHKERYKDQSYE